MNDYELIKTMWTVAQYGDNQKVGGLLQMAAHRLEELGKVAAEAQKQLEDLQRDLAEAREQAWIAQSGED